MKKPLLSSVLSVVALAVIVVAVTRCSAGPETSPAGAPSPVAVALSAASLDEVGQPFEIGGDVRARESAVITSRIVAEVRAVVVNPGDRVRAGQPLIVLDARDLNAAHTRAQGSLVAAEQAADAALAERQAADAALTLASATYRRVSGLRAKNSVTDNEMDQATAALRSAEARKKSTDAQVAQAQAGIEVARAAAESASIGQSYATLAAPFDGIVTQKLIDPGNMASPGTPLMTIEDVRSFRLEVRIDESRASIVTLGSQVDVTLGALDAGQSGGQSLTTLGRVAEIARDLDPNAHAFLAKIDLPAIPGLRAGMFGRAHFAGPTRRVLAVPESSVIRRGQITSVFVVGRQKVARLRMVTVGEPVGGRVEIRAGLDAGELVVVSPPVTLVDGTPVTEGRR